MVSVSFAWIESVLKYFVRVESGRTSPCGVSRWQVFILLPEH